MKTRTSVKRRGDKKKGSGYFVRRKGRLFFYDPENPKNNQRQG